MRLDPARTFASIIIGSSNARAVTLARRAVGTRRERPNPLLVRGKSGSGKTLLLHAMANELLRRQPSVRLQLMTAEEYGHALVQSIRCGKTHQLRRALTEDCDALFIDELEDAGGKPSTRELLSQAIEFHAARGQPVVLAAGPCADVGIEAMVSRYARSTIVRLRASTLAQRVTALRRMAHVRRERIPVAALRVLAKTGGTIAEVMSSLERDLAVRALLAP